MAAKLPTTIKTYNLGNIYMSVADFDGTVSSNDIDDDDTWASGLKSAVAWHVSSTIDGPQDCTIDAYTQSTGTFTFGSASAQTAQVFVYHLGF